MFKNYTQKRLLINAIEIKITCINKIEQFQSCLRGILDATPYKAVAVITKPVPSTKFMDGKGSVCSTTVLISVEEMMEMLVAKIFRTLSAYFTATATIKPPNV